MKRLNNKGMTTIEIIICFVLIVIITISLYSTVSAFNEKRILESSKEQVVNYKDLVTKAIQDDLIKVGLTHVTYNKEVNNSNKVTYYHLYFVLKDGTKRKLQIEQRLAKSSYHIGGASDQDDYFMIKYGKPDDLIFYPLPKLGSSKNEYGKTVQDLSINNVIINITDENILSIYIGFYHPELTTRYGINIVCPIDYVPNGIDGTSSWNY